MIAYPRWLQASIDLTLKAGLRYGAVRPERLVRLVEYIPLPRYLIGSNTIVYFKFLVDVTKMPIDGSPGDKEDSSHLITSITPGDK